MESWVKEAAPSDWLRWWFGHDPSKWKKFRQRHFAELDGKPEVWKSILEACRRGKATLLYGAKDREQNNAATVRGYVMAKLKRAGRRILLRVGGSWHR